MVRLKLNERPKVSRERLQSCPCTRRGFRADAQSVWPWPFAQIVRALGRALHTIEKQLVLLATTIAEPFHESDSILIITVCRADNFSATAPAGCADDHRFQNEVPPMPDVTITYRP